MIWTIARREFQDHLKSLRFLIGFIVTISLVTISTYINASDYQQRHQDFVSANEEMKSDNFYVRVYRPPEVLSPLVQGKDRKLGNRLEMSYISLPAKTTGYMGESASQQSQYVAGFASFDYAFIIRVVMSLMVIFLTYNAVCEEKAQGTLRLMYANSIPRHVFLLGKFIGGLTIILITLIVATIAALLVLTLKSATVISGSDWYRIFAIFTGSAVYLAFFCTLGLFVSVSVNRPSISLAILLQVWIFFSIVYPNLAILAAERWYQIPGEEEVAELKKAAFQPYEEEQKRSQEEFNRQVRSGQEVSNDVWLKSATLSAKKAESDHQVDMEIGRQLTRQAELAQHLANVSPSSLYDHMMERCARTGTEEFERFMDAIYGYWQQDVELEMHNIQHPEDRGKTKLANFSFSPESSSQSFQGSVTDMMVLLVLCAIFFAFAYTSFLKKDVR